MAFQGNLRDFAVTEVLQMLGSQKKTGCLMLEWNAARAVFYVLDGKMVATREPGMAIEDPLLRFLLKAHRLSNEQYRGILTIQRESNRDLEDLLVNGRYLTAEELGQYIERQILDDLMKVTTWPNGSYRFDPQRRWPNPPLTRLGVEAALIEVARRVDEQQRFSELRADPLRILGVRDLPDTEAQLSEEECELFGLIDGNHTVAEVIEAAPLSEYEAYEALYRMIDSNWVEFVGRREAEAAPPDDEPGAGEEAPAGRSHASRVAPSLSRELVVGAVAIVLLLALAGAGRILRPPTAASASTDVFAAAQMRDVRFALQLYHRERGRYPDRLDDLITGRWISRSQTRIAGKPLDYRPGPERQSFVLERTPR